MCATVQDAQSKACLSMHACRQLFKDVTPCQCSGTTARCRQCNCFCSIGCHLLGRSWLWSSREYSTWHTRSTTSSRPGYSVMPLTTNSALSDHTVWWPFSSLRAGLSRIKGFDVVLASSDLLRKATCSSPFHMYRFHGDSDICSCASPVAGCFRMVLNPPPTR